jgi:hypothetical protein
MMRFAACTACLLVAARCFDGGIRPNELPMWVWTLVGIGWLFNAAYIAIRGTDK